MGAVDKVTGLVQSLDIVELHIVGQALEDVLRYELGLPLEGIAFSERPLIYGETLYFLQQEYPTVYQRLQKIPSKLAWLRELEYARK